MKKALPELLRAEILAIARKHCVQRVVLFGSRARGNQTERSDIDLAASGGDIDSFAWDLKENSHTLLMFDVVNMDKAVSEELAAEIARDGVTLYEKT